METNKRILKTGIIIIIVTLILGLGATFYLNLDNPVFLKSYIEIDMPIQDNGKFGHTNFEIRYITNVNDNRIVDHLEFDEAPEVLAYTSEHNINYNLFGNNDGETQGRYNIRSIYVTLEAYEVEKTAEEIHLTTAKIYFSNGEIIESDIGDIVLYGYNNPDERFQLQYYKRPYGESVRTQETFQEEKTLIKVEVPILEEVNEFMEFKIDNVDYDNITEKTYSAGDSLVVDRIFRTPDDPILKFNTYTAHPKMTFKDKEGNLSYRFYSMEYRKHGFEFNEIVKYLRARGEL